MTDQPRPLSSVRRNTLPALDGLRAVAVSWVLFSHFWTYPAATPLLNRFAAAGWAGVDLFFVLSGFLITRVLIGDDARPDYYRRFYARRVRRIVPVYATVLLIVLVGFPLVSASKAVDHARADWLWYVTFLSNVRLAWVGEQLFALDLTWSLAVEEQFYLVWPAVQKVLRIRGMYMLSLGLIVLLPLVRWFVCETHLFGRTWLDLLVIFRADSLAMGALLACVEYRMRGRQFGEEASALFAAVALAIVGATAAGWMTRIGGGEFSIVVAHTLLALLAAIAIYAAVTRDNWLARALSWAPFRQFGRVSYGLYLYQGVVLAVASTVLVKATGLSLDALSSNPVVASVLRVLVATAATYAVAWCSYTIMEEPLLRRPISFGGSVSLGRTLT